ncbi:MAG: hypothetical protein V2A76_13070 [Planctomycetota bacterium]
MTSWNEILPQVHDLVDGRLSAAEERELLRRIEGNAEFRRRFQELRALKKGLLELSDERAPDDLAARVMAALEPGCAAGPTGHPDDSGTARPWLRLLGRYGALAASLAAVLFIGSLFLDRDGARDPAPATDMAQVDSDEFDAKDDAGERSEEPDASILGEEPLEEQDKILDRLQDRKAGLEKAEAAGLAGGSQEELEQDLEDRKDQVMEGGRQADQPAPVEDLRPVKETLDSAAPAPFSDLLAVLERKALMGKVARDESLAAAGPGAAAPPGKKSRREDSTVREGRAASKSRSAPQEAAPVSPLLLAARRPAIVAGADRLLEEEPDPLFVGLQGTTLPAAEALPLLPEPLLAPARELVRHYGDRVRFLELDRAGLERLRSNAGKGRISLRDLTRPVTPGPAGPATPGAKPESASAQGEASGSQRYLLMLVFEE